MRKYYIDKKIFSVLIFMVLNIPSIKLLWSSPVINIAALIGIWGLGAYKLYIKRLAIKVNEKKRVFITLFLSMWSVMFIVTTIKMPYKFGINEILQYIVVIGMVIGVILFAQEEEVQATINMQILWGISLALMYLLGWIKLDINLGQHYLTLGMPIGIACVSLLHKMIYSKLHIKQKILSIIGIFPMIIVLTQLKGRTPILLVLVIPVITTLINILMGKNKKNKFRYVFVMSVLMSVVMWVGYNNLSDEWIMRISRLSTIQNEPRYYVYVKSLEIIKDNIFGIGLNGLSEFGLGYPHNIFLEVILSGGILALLIFIMMLFLVMWQAVKIIRQNICNITIISMCLFYFITWNISFDLSGAYIPFTAIALVFCIDNSIINKQIIKG